MSREQIKDCKRCVLKVGSALLTADGTGLDVSMIENLAQQVATLRNQNVEILIVSSGSVAAGVSQLNMKNRPERVNELQAAAAVGQASLVRQYEQAFQPYELTIAQVLLTHADIANRERYLNAKSTLSKLLEMDVITVINENDTVATEEICFGDNDNLAALVANMVSADLLIILTDQDGLYSADPRTNSGVELIEHAEANDSALVAMASGGSSVGRGGMITKLTAAQSASRSGANTIIANGREPDVILRVIQGEKLGTFLKADNQLASRKQWMAGQLKISGTIVLDHGAIGALKSAGKSLLPVGIKSVKGNFKRGELVACVDEVGIEIARGLSNYNAEEAYKIIGQSSDKITELLGYGGEDEFIHRDNLVLSLHTS
ncbi:MAG: glutamate 5-kinase [Acidiferrobacterales bacterium]|nr:glutamate 5-kinase [Acidiferrobacterales bacterium]